MHGTRLHRRTGHARQVIALAIDPRALRPSESVFCSEQSPTRSVTVRSNLRCLDVLRGRRRILHQVMQQPGNHDVFIEACSIEDPGYSHDMLEIGQFPCPPHLTLVAQPA